MWDTYNIKYTVWGDPYDTKSLLSFIYIFLNLFSINSKSQTFLKPLTSLQKCNGSSHFTRVDTYYQLRLWTFGVGMCFISTPWNKKRTTSSVKYLSTHTIPLKIIIHHFQRWKWNPFILSCVWQLHLLVVTFITRYTTTLHIKLFRKRAKQRQKGEKKRVPS